MYIYNIFSIHIKKNKAFISGFKFLLVNPLNILYNIMRLNINSRIYIILYIRSEYRIISGIDIIILFEPANSVYSNLTITKIT